MKKWIALLMCAMMLVCALPAVTFAEGEDISGDWYLNRMREGDQEMDASYLSLMGLESVTLTLNADGTMAMDFGGDKSEGTWVYEGGAGTLTSDGSDVAFTVADGELTMGEGDEWMIFTREQPTVEAFEASPVVEAPALEDFNGEWKAVTIVAAGLPLPMSMGGGSEINITIQDGNITYKTVTEGDDGEMKTDEFSVVGELVDGTLKAVNGLNSLTFQMHEDGTMTDGYTLAVEGDPNMQEAAAPDFYTIYEKAE
ncbi:MAG: hypothetical protein IJX90_03850 [Blautia sp.]|nr:hypothetical protein [Blautia sp.]